MIYLGVDPGMKGALAWIIGPQDVVILEPMPVFPGPRPEFDLARIRDSLSHAASSEGLFVAVERSQPLPRTMGGAISNFHRGQARGWSWLLVGMSISHVLVMPRVWQREMHEGTSGVEPKGRSLQAAMRLFPRANLRRSLMAKKPDVGLAEALHIAEWGRRHHRP